jgi:hypothetical protein
VTLSRLDFRINYSAAVNLTDGGGGGGSSYGGGCDPGTFVSYAGRLMSYNFLYVLILQDSPILFQFETDHSVVLLHLILINLITDTVGTTGYNTSTPGRSGAYRQVSLLLLIYRSYLSNAIIMLPDLVLNCALYR